MNSNNAPLQRYSPDSFFLTLPRAEERKAHDDLAIQPRGNDVNVFPYLQIINCETKKETDAMAFINEPISAEDQERIQYSTLKDPQGGGSIPDLPRWTADHGRNAFLLRLGGGMSREDYHVPYYFLFGWYGMLIRVDAYRHEQAASDPTAYTLTWEVVRMHLPDVLSATHEEIKQLLTEAFDVRGSNSYDESRASFEAVHVDYSNLQEYSGTYHN